jgi:hypothetical protein
MPSLIRLRAFRRVPSGAVVRAERTRHGSPVLGSAVFALKTGAEISLGIKLTLDVASYIFYDLHGAQISCIKIFDSVREEKLFDVPVGLLFNFHEIKLVDGFTRLVLSGANKI